MIKRTVHKEKSLFKFAEKISLGDFIYMGKGEENSGGRNRPSIVSDAFEAVIAAMYLDGGIEVVKNYILSFISEAVKREANFKDNKSLLQEIIQKNKGSTISYEEIGESGPDHEKVFKFVVKINGEIVGTGEGRSKKEAEQAAAGDALEKIGV
jgi:ribonuclease-3